MDHSKKRQVALMAILGWVIAFLTMLLVKDWNIVSALFSLPSVMVGFIAFATLCALGKQVPHHGR